MGCDRTIVLSYFLFLKGCIFNYLYVLRQWPSCVCWPCIFDAGFHFLMKLKEANEKLEDVPLERKRI